MIIVIDENGLKSVFDNVGTAELARMVSHHKEVFFKLVEDNELILVKDMIDTFIKDETLGQIMPKCGFHINAVDHRGHTALMIALLNKNTDMAAMLLDEGADPGITNPRGFTPLMQAVVNGDAKSVDALLKAGAEPNRQNSIDGTTALIHLAYWPNIEILNLLIEAGADPSIKDNENHNAYDYAKAIGHKDVIAIMGEAMNSAPKQGASPSGPSPK